MDVGLQTEVRSLRSGRKTRLSRTCNVLVEVSCGAFSYSLLRASESSASVLYHGLGQAASLHSSAGNNSRIMESRSSENSTRDIHSEMDTIV